MKSTVAVPMARASHAVAFAVMLLLPACSEGDEGAMHEDAPGLLARAAVSGDSARATVMRAYPGAEVEKAEIEEEDGRLIYSFDLDLDDEEVEVHVDAMTGRLDREAGNGD